MKVRGPVVVGVVVLLLGVGLVAADRWVAAQLPTAGQLSANLAELELDAEDKNLLILGTCLSEQHIRIPVLNGALPEPWTVHNIGAAATTPVEWYLAWKNFLPHDRVDALAIAYGRLDLTEPMTPWESETLDLARGDDMAGIIDASCENAECRLDLRLQRWSALWRYRPVLAGLIWHRLGMAPPTDPRQARLRVVNGLRSTNADVWDPQSASVVYLTRLVTEARAEGVTVMFMPLPLRPDPLDNHQAQVVARLQSGLAGVIAETGAVSLGHADLPREVYTDEVHMTPEGVEQFTAWLGEVLPAVLRE